MKEYFENPSISRSDLVNLDVHPKVFKNPNRSESDAFRIGSAFDELMYFPKTWHEKYHIFSNPHPSGMMSKLCERYIALKTSKDQWMTEDEIFDDAFKVSGYVMTKETVRDNFVKTPLAYCREFASHGSKKEVSQQEAEMMNSMKRALLSDPLINKYFIPGNDLELHFQVPIYWEEPVTLEGVDSTVPCKVLVDTIAVDHVHKRIYPIDLKTTGDSVYKFPNSYKHYKYYLQAAMYQRGVRYWAIDQGFDLYDIDNFRFIVVEKALINPPLIFKVSTKDLVAGRSGFTSIYGHRIRGWKDLLTDLHWHTRHNKWDHPRSVYESEEVLLNELSN